MKNIIPLKTLLMMMMFFHCSLPVMAQFDDPDEEEDEDGYPLNPAPIDDYIVPMLVLGIAAGYYLIKRKTALTEK